MSIYTILINVGKSTVSSKRKEILYFLRNRKGEARSNRNDRECAGECRDELLSKFFY